MRYHMGTRIPIQLKSNGYQGIKAQDVFIRRNLWRESWKMSRTILLKGWGHQNQKVLLCRKIQRQIENIVCVCVCVCVCECEEKTTHLWVWMEKIKGWSRKGPYDILNWASFIVKVTGSNWRGCSWIVTWAGLESF